MLNWKHIEGLARNGNPKPPRRVEKTDEEWKAELSPDVYQVTRKAGTERPFSSELCSKFDPGVYACACCKTRLFDATTKFDSGTGWPSFTEPVEPTVVAYRGDFGLGMTRIETVCNVCDAHLGHVFPDGPKATTGLRFCINAIALVKDES